MKTAVIDSDIDEALWMSLDEIKANKASLTQHNGPGLH